MQDVEGQWTERARYEFASLFDDASSSDTLRMAVADALTRGWSNNRDKPLWLLAIAIAALGDAVRQGHCDDRVDGLAIIYGHPRSLFRGLLDCASDPSNESISFRQGKLAITFDGTTLQLSEARLRILSKIAEFLLIADDFGNTQQVMVAFAELHQSGLGKPDGIKGQVRLFARWMYRYRVDQFRDTGTNSPFQSIMKFCEQLDFMIEDDSIVEFWTSDLNHHFRTYTTCFLAFVDFHDELREIVRRRELASANSIDAPGPHAKSMDIEADVEWITADDDDPATTRLQAVDTLANHDVKLLTAAQKRLLRQLATVGQFGADHILSTLRMIAFHPVQSGLSNSLRTGRSRLTLDERLRCVEAISYSDIATMLAKLENSLVELLKMSLARRLAETAAEGEEFTAVEREGAILLSKFRKRRSGHLADTMDWTAIEAALIASREFTGIVSERVTSSVGDGLTDKFHEDQLLFSEILTQFYSDASSSKSGSVTPEG